MATAYTSLLGLALPVTGELSGTWGSTVNTEITALLDSAIAGTTTLSTDADVTLTTTTGAANTSRQAILLCSGARTVLRTITAPAQSKIYTVINATTGGFSVKLVGAGPTTGVTIVAGESAVCAWNGSDFIKISNTAGVGTFTNLTVTGTLGVTGAGSIQGLTVGRGAGAVATNTAVGASALAANQAGGTNNTAIGNAALDANTTGDANTAIGDDALGANTTGSNNTAVGNGALQANTTASDNTVVGYQAGYTGTTTTDNVFVGYQAGYSATTGNGRGVFVGKKAGYGNTTGTDNVCIGYFAGYTNQTGIANVYIGGGYFGSENPAGYLATGSQNTFVGYSAGNTVTTGAKNTILGGYDGNQGGLDIRTASNYIVLSDGDGNPRQIIDSSGNLLVGTTTSIGPLTVDSGSGATGFININSPVTTDANQTLGFSIQDGNHGVFLLKDGSGIAINELLFKEFGGVFKFINSNTNAVPMTLDGSGNLLVGTTSSPNAARVYIRYDSLSTQPIINSATTVAASTNWNHFIGQSGNGSSITTNNIFIKGNGNVENANNSYGAISDIKLKENIVDASPKLDKLMQVRIRNYNLKGDYEQHKQIGVIAQELETVFPSIVDQTPDIDAEGNDLGTTTKSVKYSVFVPMLIKAIQELKAEVDSLKAQINGASA